MFKKTLTAAVAALTIAGATVTNTSSAQAGFGSVVAAAAVGAVVGAVVASRSEAQPVYRPAPQPVARPVSVCPVGTHIGPQGHYCWANN